MIHNVYFWLKPGLSAEQRSTFETELMHLLEIDYLEHGFVGKPADTEKRPVCDHSFSYSLTLHFKNMQDHVFYQNSIAGGVNSGIRKMEAPVPLYFDHGRGARLWDVDGNEYIDFKLGQGALLYGHAPAGMAAAIAAQAQRGTHWAGQSELEPEVAERVQRMIPSAELVRFSNSATEAVGAAFRLARSCPHRPAADLALRGPLPRLGDEGLVGFANPMDHWGDDERPAQLHPSKGVIPEVLQTFIVVRWNDTAHFRRRVEEHRGRIAAVVFEPALCNTCCIEPAPGLMAAIRELCDRDGMLMIRTRRSPASASAPAARRVTTATGRISRFWARRSAAGRRSPRSPARRTRWRRSCPARSSMPAL
jgi:hypothetical protein